jgi:hypothetical protein
MYDIFVSYSRKDKAFVQKLVRALEKSGRNIWVDFDDIPFGADWWSEVCGGIEASQTVVFVISPDSIKSEVCGLEIKHVLDNKKRLVPILHREIPAKEVPYELSHLNWIMFDHEVGFDNSVVTLLDTVDTDLDKARQHTRLLVRTSEWQRMHYSPSLLLRGDELSEMEPMLDRSDLTDAQREFLVRSQKEQFRGRVLGYYLRGWISACLVAGFWAFSAFRSDILITPVRVVYTVSVGLGMGIFIAILPILADTRLTEMLTRQFPPNVEQFLTGLRGKLVCIFICLAAGILTWASYLWFLDSLDFSPPIINALMFGGLGLAAGFIICILFDVSAWLAAVLTAILTWVPIYLTFQDASSGGTTFLPLIFFHDDPSQVFSIGIVFAVLIALTANAPRLWSESRNFYQRLRSSRKLTTKLT